MKSLTTLVMIVALAVGGAGATFAYQSAASLPAGAGAASAEAPAPKPVKQVRLAECRPGTTPRKDKCVRRVVRTVVAPADDVAEPAGGGASAARAATAAHGLPSSASSGPSAAWCEAAERNDPPGYDGSALERYCDELDHADDVTDTDRHSSDDSEDDR
jgi:hypothetical protein